MNLYFIRHGDPNYQTDSLTDLGKTQAQKLAEALKVLQFDEIYQSSLGRAKETCAYSAKNWGITPVTLDWAKELCWGDKSGNAYATDSPWTINQKLISEKHYYPDGESWRQLPELQQDRLIEDIDSRCQALDAFLAEHGYIREGQLYRVEQANSKNIAIFCHGGVSCAFMAHLLNIPFWQFIAHTGLKVTSISKIGLSGETGNYCAAQIHYLNDYKHLDKTETTKIK